MTGRLLVAPGRRYRLETTGEDGRRCLEGCDGDRPWHQLSQPEDGSHIQIFGDPQPPEPELLHPSWLLTGFDLGLADVAVVGGREGYRVVATPRSSSPGADSVAQRRPGRVEVVVDAELGILLRCEKISGGQVQRVSELHDVVPGPREAADPAQFAAPPGSIISESGPSFGAAFGPVAKTAGGLGAAILASAIRRAGRRATPAEPDETIPHDEGDEAWAQQAAADPSIGDDLVYRLPRAATPALHLAEYYQSFDPRGPGRIAPVRIRGPGSAGGGDRRSSPGHPPGLPDSGDRSRPVPDRPPLRPRRP